MRASTGRRMVGACLALLLLASTTTAAEASQPAGAEAAASPVAVSPAATTIIDTTDRAAVRAAYRNRYLPSSGVPTGWTGSVGGCVPGGTSAAYRKATKTQINYFRGLVGLPGVVLDPELNAQSQAAALMMDAADALNHSPGTDWPCSTKAGRDGAGHSNLCLGCSTADLSGYVEDPGGGNTAVGHRRWLLFPRQTTMGVGATTSANAMYVLDTATWTAPPANARWIAWPPAGYLPRQHISGRFSLTRAGADFSAATARVWFDGTRVAATVVSRNGPYGDPTIVLEVTLDRFLASDAAKDHVFKVTVKGILVDGQPVDRSWRTTVFDAR